MIYHLRRIRNLVVISLVQPFSGFMTLEKCDLYFPFSKDKLISYTYVPQQEDIEHASLWTPGSTDRLTDVTSCSVSQKFAGMDLERWLSQPAPC